MSAPIRIVLKSRISGSTYNVSDLKSGEIMTDEIGTTGNEVVWKDSNDVIHRIFTSETFASNDATKGMSLIGTESTFLGLAGGNLKTLLTSLKNHIDTTDALKVPLSRVSDHDIDTSSDLPTCNQVKSYVETYTESNGFRVLPDVIDIQEDANLNPGTTPSTGDRYLISDSLALHANFGTISGLSSSDIVEYTGSEWEVAFDANVEGLLAQAMVRSNEDAQIYIWNTTSWNDFGDFHKAGTGLSLSNDAYHVNVDDVSIKVSASDALEIKMVPIEKGGLGLTWIDPTSADDGKLLKYKHSDRKFVLVDTINDEDGQNEI